MASFITCEVFAVEQPDEPSHEETVPNLAVWCADRLRMDTAEHDKFHTWAVHDASCVSSFQQCDGPVQAASSNSPCDTLAAEPELSVSHIRSPMSKQVKQENHMLQHYHQQAHLLCKHTFIQYVPSMLWRCRLGGRKGIWPVQNWVVGCWCGYMPESRCRSAYGPGDATVTHYLGPVNPDCFYLSGAGLPGYSRTKSKRAVKRLCVCLSVSTDIYASISKNLKNGLT